MKGKQLHYLATLPLNVCAGGAERHIKGVSTINGDHRIGRKQLLMDFQSFIEFLETH